MNAPSLEERPDPIEPEAPPSDPRSRRHREGDVIASRYRLIEHLGKGGMGTVWLGRDQELDRNVAIKFMTEDAANNPDLRQRFRREAKAAAALNSRHVVEIYDHGVDAGTPYIVMERLEGEDLRSRLKRVGVLGLPEVTEIVVQAGKALQRAQKAGIVHRDLKPANLFLSKVDNEETVKVLDFGVAKHTGASDDTHATKTGVVLGSPPYMSPEQARGRELDHRADLWSLTAIAYRALTGHIPFSGDSDGDIIVKICTESPAPASKYVPAFGPELDALFERAFARDPDERFQTAHELSAAFCRLGGVEAPPTIVATPVSTVRQVDDTPAPADGPTAPLTAAATTTARDDGDFAETTPLQVGPTPTRGRSKAAVLLLVAGGVLAFAVLRMGSGDEPQDEPAPPEASGPAVQTAPAVAEPATPEPPDPEPTPTTEPSASTTSAVAASPSQTAPRPAPPPRRPKPQAPPSKPKPEPGNPWGY